MDASNEDIVEIRKPPLHAGESERMTDIRKPTRQAAEAGLASLLMGGILALLAMLLILIDLQLFAHPAPWARGDLTLLLLAAVLGMLVLPGLSVFSIILGIRGVRAGQREEQPTALGWAGILISVLALALWIGAIADLMAVTSMLMRRLHGGFF